MSGRSFLLAAGHGRRAGGPKAWLARDGRTLLERQLDFLVPRFGAKEVFVSVQEPWLPRCRALAADVRWIAVDPDAEAIDSLRDLARAAGTPDWTFVHHVDMPVWEPAVFDALRPGDFDAAAPRFEGRRGHPVLLSPGAAGALETMTRLDVWLRGRRVREVDVPFPCVRENWNFPPTRP